MPHRFQRFITGLALCVFSWPLLTWAQNHAPQVKIVKPDPAATLPLSQLIPFKISVSDKEDGDSKYDEINGAEVFLRVQQVANREEVTSILSEAGQRDDPGFVLLQKSNCVNCHAFRAPGIGPSFADICARYPNSITNVMVLTQRVLSGASGVWGTQVMPSHPEFTKEQAREIISWILTNTGNPATTYYFGTEGTLTLNPSSETSSRAIFVLRASYTDHGTPGDSVKLQGEDAIVVQGKP